MTRPNPTMQHICVDTRVYRFLRHCSIIPTHLISRFSGIARQRYRNTAFSRQTCDIDFYLRYNAFIGLVPAKIRPIQLRTQQIHRIRRY